MFCPNCKHENEESALFCYHCGMKLLHEAEERDGVGNSPFAEKKSISRSVLILWAIGASVLIIILYRLIGACLLGWLGFGNLVHIIVLIGGLKYVWLSILSKGWNEEDFATVTPHTDETSVQSEEKSSDLSQKKETGMTALVGVVICFVASFFAYPSNVPSHLQSELLHYFDQNIPLGFLAEGIVIIGAVIALIGFRKITPKRKKQSKK